jgi:excisionase family DNA binding protein
MVAAISTTFDVASLMDGRELTIEEAAYLRKVTTRTIQNWIGQGLQAVRYGHSIRIKPDALAAFGVPVVKAPTIHVRKNTKREVNRIEASYAEAERLLR